MSPLSFDLRDIPVLTEAVDLAAEPTAAPAPEQAASVTPEPVAVVVPPPPDTAALHAAIVEDALNLAARLTGEAARDIEVMLYEQVVGRLRGELPGIVERILREHLPGSAGEPDDPHG